MDVQQNEALGILQGAFTGQNFDRVRQAYHVHANYLTHIQKESPVVCYPTNYQEFVEDALTEGNYCAAVMANFRALCGIPFEKFYTDWKK